MTPSVLGILRGRRGGLQPSLRRVADAVLEDPAACAELTVTELAKMCGVSQSTVMRMCRALGLDGYRELRTRLVSEIAVNDANGVRELLRGDISPLDDLESAVRKIVHADVQAVEDTMAALSLADLAVIVDLMLSSHRTLVFGVGASGLVAQDFESKLTRIGLPARAFTETHAALMSVALLTPADVMVAISHSGTTTEILDVLGFAKSRGTPTVAITNGAQSELALAADHCLLTAAHESSFRSAATGSRLAQLVVVDCVFVAIAQRSYAHSQTALELTRDAVESRRRGR